MLACITPIIPAATRRFLGTSISVLPRALDFVAILIRSFGSRPSVDLPGNVFGECDVKPRVLS